MYKETHDCAPSDNIKGTQHARYAWYQIQPWQRYIILFNAWKWERFGKNFQIPLTTDVQIQAYSTGYLNPKLS